MDRIPPVKPKDCLGNLQEARRSRRRRNSSRERRGRRSMVGDILMGLSGAEGVGPREHTGALVAPPLLGHAAYVRDQVGGDHLDAHALPVRRRVRRVDPRRPPGPSRGAPEGDPGNRGTKFPDNGVPKRRGVSARNVDGPID
eukprot:8080664-Pyramimonas_sp.AAC.1